MLGIKEAGEEIQNKTPANNINIYGKKITQTSFSGRLPTVLQLIPFCREEENDGNDHFERNLLFNGDKRI